MICPPSTFCFWPGFVQSSPLLQSQIQNNTKVNMMARTVYLSPGRLFRYQPHISSAFHWLVKPKVVRLLSRDDIGKVSYEDILSKLTKTVAKSQLEFANVFMDPKIS